MEHSHSDEQTRKEIANNIFEMMAKNHLKGENYGENKIARLYVYSLNRIIDVLMLENHIPKGNLAYPAVMGVKFPYLSILSFWKHYSTHNPVNEEDTDAVSKVLAMETIHSSENVKWIDVYIDYGTKMSNINKDAEMKINVIDKDTFKEMAWRIYEIDMSDS